VPPRRYQIEVDGRLPAGAEREFPGMVVRVSGRTTTLVGIVPDAAALYGIVARLEALGVTLLAAQPDPAPSGGDSPTSDDGPAGHQRRPHA
jgi:hypothetical protein